MTSAIAFGGASSARAFVGHALVQWSHVPGATSYLIHDMSSGAPVLMGSVLAPQNQLLVPGLAPDRDYRFRVRMIDHLGLADANAQELAVRTAAASTYRARVLADGPVGYWRLGEAVSATTVADETSSGLTGAVIGAAGLGAPGASGTDADTAANFAGGGYVNLGNPSALQLTGDLTIEFWIRPSAFPFIRKTVFAKAYGGEFAVVFEPAGSLHFYYGTAGANAGTPFELLTPAGTIRNERWHHAAAVRDLAGGQLRWYVDGALVATGAAPAPAAVSALNVSINNGYLGASDCSLDEISVYDRALSPAELAAHYEAAL